MPQAQDFPQALSAHPAFNLAGNPFEPILPLTGQTIRYRYADSGPLRPHDCEEHLHLYFNVYEWKDADRLNGLGSDGRLTVLHRPNDDRAMVILISGIRGSGRTSALNLLKYEIRKRAAVPPVEFEYATSIRLKINEHLKGLSLALSNAIERAKHEELAEKIMKSLKRWTDTMGQDAGSPELLFDMFKQDIADLQPGLPIVIALDARDHKVTSDVWRSICSMLSHVADYIIVTLTDREQAQHFRGYLEVDSFQAAWIDAPRITKGKIIQYLSANLAKHRMTMPAAPGLEPFTEGALQALVDPAGAGVAQQPLTIALAMSRLAGVFQRKATALEQHVANGAQLTSTEVLINRKDMEDYLASL